MNNIRRGENQSEKEKSVLLIITHFCKQGSGKLILWKERDKTVSINVWCWITTKSINIPREFIPNYQVNIGASHPFSLKTCVVHVFVLFFSCLLFCPHGLGCPTWNFVRSQSLCLNIFWKL